MRLSTLIKSMLRKLLGDGITSSIHARRFVKALRRNPLPEAEAQLVPRFLPPGSVGVDIGANGADWTMAMSKAVGPAGRVFAFEANPYYAKVTQKTVGLLGLGNVTFFSFGLSDRPEDAHMVVQSVEGESLSGQGYVCRNPQDLAQAGGRTVGIHLERLDDLAAKHPQLRAAKLIKCDTEGFELAVFRGARGLLASARPVVVLEVGHGDLHGFDDRDLLALFAELGYKPFRYDTVRGELVALADLRAAGNLNCVMIPGY